MTDILLHFEWHTPEQAKADLKARVLPWIGEQLECGRALAGDIGEYEADITRKQRAFLHAVALTEIAQFASVNGQRFDMKVWKEWYRSEFLGFNVVASVNPFTGRTSRRRVRISTEDLGIKGMAEYIDRVIAHAATVLNVQVSEPLPPELRPQRRRARAIENGNIDADTGEILETADA